MSGLVQVSPKPPRPLLDSPMVAEETLHPLSGRVYGIDPSRVKDHLLFLL